ncbi:hemolysin III family protein [Bifidobacterium sp. BRDM6]|uniref:Hemolysin III family protein n=2 Tax=Bifidobacterium choloepi TaxID=2614131 RepID=A0A6I5NBU9_9BIFI|nr:hemolysin III family protein [Bifidobacterium choloepi]
MAQSARRQTTLTARQLHEHRQEIADAGEYRERRKQLMEKPLMRGWIHLVTFPLCVAASIVLICLAPAGAMKAAVSIYSATAMLLFGVSAALHIGHGHVYTRIDSILVRIDYSNIFLVIAGTNTPFLFAITNTTVRWVYLVVIWAVALIGTAVHLVFPDGLDWLFTIVYCVLGLAPFTIIHLFWTSPYIGPVPTILLICGGAAYILGAVCFALRKPNPWPRVFGYHELFHLGTVIGYACHLVAIFMTVCAMR